MKKLLLVTFLFVLLMGYLMGNNVGEPGWAFAGFMWGLVLLIWVTFATIVLGVVKMIFRGAVRVTKNEWRK